MAYGQINYNFVNQGIPPTRYTVAQIGCLLVAFCNLSKRFGIDVSPVRLNSFFRDNKVYIDVDDGFRDDLYWGAIQKFDKRINLTGVVKSAKPRSVNSIVKMKSRNTFGTHFCLVKKIAGSSVYIIDSWDGKVKNANNYGGIIEYANYKFTPSKPKKIKTKTPILYHTIIKGDTFWLLENKYNIPHGRLQILNRHIDPKLLQIGSKIRIK